MLGTFYGFVSLCLVSSSYYIINDMIDISKDKKHPEKKNRPLASGKIRIWQALIIMLVLLAGSLAIAYGLSNNFLYSVLFLFAFSLIYSIWLKHEVFADVITIAINFVVKAASGAFIINVVISPWLVVCAFFLAMFLVFGKRKSELEFLNENEYEYKRVLKQYSVNVLEGIVNLTAAVSIVTYSLYCFLSAAKGVIWTLPIVAYAIFRYLGFINSGSVIARHPENVFKDRRMLISMFLWLLIAFLGVYL